MNRRNKKTNLYCNGEKSRGEPARQKGRARLRKGNRRREFPSSVSLRGKGTPDKANALGPNDEDKIARNKKQIGRKTTELDRTVKANKKKAQEREEGAPKTKTKKSA